MHEDSSDCAPGCQEYTFHQNSIFYKSDALLGEDLRNIIQQFPYLKEEDFHEKHNKLAIYSGLKFWITFFKKSISASLSIQEKLMITSDEEAEYNILDLFSDIGGGLGIFLGLSIMRLVSFA